jgi:hypothetical protein
MRGIFAGCCACVETLSAKSKEQSAKPKTVFFTSSFRFLVLGALLHALCGVSSNHSVALTHTFGGIASQF